MKTRRQYFSLACVIIFLALYFTPLISIIVFSFNEAKSVTHFTNFSLIWYKDLFTNTRLLEIIFYTIGIAVISTIISTIIGTIVSICLAHTNKNMRNSILKINNLPIINPDIVTGIGLLLLFVSLSIERSYFTMLIAHISFCTPYVILNVYPKVKALDPNIFEAAEDLGAKPYKAMKDAILPQIKGSIISAAAISFTMSFDDFVISYFTGGSNLNISTYLYTEAKKINPTINALSTIIILIIIIKVVVDLIKESKDEKNEKKID
ncbi:MAG: ABC transporter permease [Acholeplasmatales bacterium]|nr:ABC transporter permease [Acholeplasmatales bacterium]